MRWLPIRRFTARPFLVLALLTLLAATLVAVAPGRADAFSEKRYVVRVLDGDTIEVAPPGQTSGPVSVIRMTGIQANETWQCHGSGATERLRGLIEGKWVTLRSDHATSKSTDGRWLRFVDYGSIDLGELLIDEGHAMAFTGSTEPARNEKYMFATYNASLRGQRLWDPTACGVGPKQNLPLRVTVRWDAVGGESSLNGEWATIHNDGTTDLSLAGWQFRDGSAAGTRTFPSNAVVKAGGTYRVYPGSGTNTPSRWYWGRTSQLFEASGDGAYLLDPDDDIRAYYIYPCTVDCTDPLQGKVQVTANYDAEGQDATNPNGEWINIANVSNGTVDLEGYELRSGGQLYYFPSNSKVHSGERMRVYAGPGSDGRLAKYWGHTDGALRNAGDSVELITVDLRPIGSHTWPCDPCGPVADVDIVGMNWDVPGRDLPNEEWIDIRNNGSTAVDLRDWMLKDSSHFLDFSASRTLAAGATLRIYIGSGTDTASTVYWGQPEPILGSNEIIRLESPHRDLIACHAQGDYSCEPVAKPVFCEGVPATIVGTAAADTIVGTAGADVIVGLGGADTIYGRGGDDRICGGGGADVLYGGVGNDRIYGGSAPDLLAGGPGNDAMFGNGGDDTVTYAAAAGPVRVDLGANTATGEGTDIAGGIENAIGSPFDDVLLGGGGPNRLEGGEGNDSIRGRHGADIIFGGNGDDTILGGKRGDTIFGGSGRDRLEGRAGQDVIRGETGPDTIKGNGGDDRLYGGPGSDAIHGGTGFDVCSSGAPTACEQ